MNRYFWNILVSIDQFFNTVFGGDPDETMSSRFGKWLRLPHNTWKWKVAYIICRILNLFQDRHCDISIEEDEGDRDLLK